MVKYSVVSVDLYSGEEKVPIETRQEKRKPIIIGLAPLSMLKGILFVRVQAPLP